MHALETPTPTVTQRPRDERRRNGDGRCWGPRAVRHPSVELVAIGLDHTTAGIELRERVAFADNEIRTVLEQLTDPSEGPLEQAAILSTCNRVEIYGAARSAPSRAELAAYLSRYHGIDARELAGALYFHRGDGVSHHLAATAAGIHSLVLGEAQIQGQVRTALKHALRAGKAGPELRRLFESAIAAGRRVRSETALGRGIASVPQASVEFACRRRGTLRHSTVLLIGAGTTGELAAKQLVKHGVRELLVLGRDAARATAIAHRYGARAVTADGLTKALGRSDVVITATSAPTPVLSRGDLARGLGHRRGGEGLPLLVIDLAVPRDVDPAAAELRGVEIYTLDDLTQLVEQTLVERSAELPAAHRVLGAEVARFTDWMRRRETVARRYT